ncbi:hypothetical protein P7H06_08530 [Paenibacillus larvae]|nr:hypothetical protein [Paenibacillus larvae]MDT2259551.1 hypothetical protein [Paenibacillus larvae]
MEKSIGMYLDEEEAKKFYFLANEETGTKQAISPDEFILYMIQKQIKR